MTSDIVEKAKAKAAQDIAKAQRQAEIVEMLPDTGMAPLVVLHHNNPAAVIYKPETAEQILSAFDTFDRLATLDCKGDYRRTTYDGGFDPDKHGNVLSDYAGWIELQARCVDYLSGAQHASIRFFATLPDGAVIEVHLDVTDARYQKGPFPDSLRVRFINSNKSGRGATGWTCNGAPVARIADAYVSFATGAPHSGMAHQGKAFFSSRDFLVELFGQA